MPSGSSKKISAKKRFEGIKLVDEDGMGIKEAAKKIGIGHSTLSKFVQEYRQNGNKIKMDDYEETTISTSSPKVSELADLKAIIKKLKGEKEVLKKTISILMSDE